MFVWSCGSRGAKAVLTVLSQTPFSPLLLALALQHNAGSDTLQSRGRREGGVGTGRV